MTGAARAVDTSNHDGAVELTGSADHDGRGAHIRYVGR
jgi:hypothetical protein